MKQKLNYYIIKFLLSLGKFLPKSMLFAFSKWVLMLYYHKKKVRRDITHANLKKAFPEKSEAEIEAMAKEVYLNLSKTIAELVLINANRFDIDASVSNAKQSLAKLRELSADASSGIIYVMAHYANWELLCHFMGKNGLPLLGIVKDGKNRLIDENILIPFREKYGNQTLSHSGSMISIAKALKSNKSIVMAIDQVVQPPNGIAVNFFGHETYASKAVAALKQKYNPKIIPIFIQRVAEGYQINIADEITSIESLSNMTQDYYDAIEAQIRKAPEQWLWLYNRWKRINI